MMLDMSLGGLSRRKVKCGICSREQKIFVGKDTFTCRGCKKTMPRRLAVTIGPSLADGGDDQTRNAHRASA